MLGPAESQDHGVPSQHILYYLTVHMGFMEFRGLFCELEKLLPRKSLNLKNE